MYCHNYLSDCPMATESPTEMEYQPKWYDRILASCALPPPLLPPFTLSAASKPNPAGGCGSSSVKMASAARTTLTSSARIASSCRLRCAGIEHRVSTAASLEPPRSAFNTTCDLSSLIYTGFPSRDSSYTYRVVLFRFMTKKTIDVSAYLLPCCSAQPAV
jgi:hypothetical protein